MATGVTGLVAFTSSGSTVRVYFTQTYTPGVGQSTVTINKVTFQAGISRKATYFFDGQILVNGVTAFAASRDGGDGSVYADGEENLISNSMGHTVTVNHTSAVTIHIALAANTYGYPTFYNYSYSNYDFTADSRSVTLAAIPMASGISAGAVTLGSEMTVSLTKAAAGMTDTVTWKCGTQSGTIAENSAETAFTWTPPVSLASQAPNGTSVSITLTTATKNGYTDAGSSSVTVSCPIPASVKPTASIAVSDEMGYLGTFGSYIRSQSKARVTTAASGAYGSWITGISITCGSLTGSGESLVFALPNAGTVSIYVTVTDSRGRTAAASSEIYVADYSPPVPRITALYRCDASGNAAADGAWAKAELSCAVTALSGQNTAACVLKYRVRGTDSWTEKTVTAPGGTVFPADTGSDYQALLTASDRFTAVSSGILTLPAAFALLDFDRKNKAVGIGQRAGTGSTISLGLPVKMGANRITDLGTPTANTDAATKWYVDTSVAKAAPRNLLDNSDFRNPVAQAGIGGNHGTAAYAADRWILASGTVSYATGTGLTLNGTIRQKLEYPPTGETSAFVGMASGAASISYADGTVTITSSGGVLKWAALYEGEYTAETLPEYHPKGYGAELLECQRYFRWLKIGGAVNGNYIGYRIPLSPAMRTNPSTTGFNLTATSGQATITAGGYSAESDCFRVDVYIGSDADKWWACDVALSADL